MQHSILLGVETHLLKGLRDDAAHHRRPRRDRRNVQEVLRYVRQKRTNASSEQKRGGETLRPNSNATQAPTCTKQPKIVARGEERLLPFTGNHNRERNYRNRARYRKRNRVRTRKCNRIRNRKYNHIRYRICYRYRYRKCNRHRHRIRYRKRIRTRYRKGNIICYRVRYRECNRHRNRIRYRKRNRSKTQNVTVSAIVTSVQPSRSRRSSI